MALRYIDSMGDHYTAAQAGLKWTSAAAVIQTTGQHGAGMRGTLTKGLSFGATILIELFIKRLVADGERLLAITDNGDNGAGTPQTQVTCSYDSTGALRVDRFSSGLLFLSDADRIRRDTWYHLAWKVFCHPTAGTLDVRLNGEVLCALTSLATISSIGGAAWSGAIGAFTLGAGSGASGTIFDDLVVMDDVDDGINDPRLPGGGGYDKFLGPVAITVKRPAGAGLTTEWTPFAGANYQNVDDTVPDDDGTYNSAAPDAVGDSDLFTMENCGIDEDVVAVQSLVLARATDEGVAAIATLVNDGGTTTVGPTVYQPSSYSYVHTPEPTRPDGSLWSAAAWDAVQYGYQRII